MNTIRQRCVELATEFFAEFVTGGQGADGMVETFKEGFTAWLKEEEGK